MDLGGNHFGLTDLSNGVLFDLNGDGKAEQLSWTPENSLVGFLALDRNENGMIDSGKELFGNFTFQLTMTNRNGFAALALYDNPEFGGNGNGEIDAGDSIYPSLRIWLDRNHDGVSQSGELLTLIDASIKSISTDYQQNSRRDKFGNVLRYRAKLESMGTATISVWAYDVLLLTSGISNAPTAISAEASTSGEEGIAHEAGRVEQLPTRY